MLSGQYVPSGSLAPSVGSSSAFVQGFTDPNFTFTSPHTLGSFLSNTTAGNFIVVVITAGNQFQTPAVSDTQGNSYSVVDSVQSSGGCICGAMLIAFNIAGGADTVTFTWNAANSISAMSVAEYACTATCGVDVHTITTLAGTWTEPTTVGPLTATGADIALTALVGCINIFGTTWASPSNPSPSGYTAHNPVNDNFTTGRGSVLADKNVPAGSFSATWSGGGVSPPTCDFIVLAGIHH